MANALPERSLLKTAGLQCKNLHDYLKSQTPEVLDRLYHNPPICLAVFRELPTIARHYVMRLLFLERPVPQMVITSWCSKLHTEEHQKVAQVLNELNVWNEVSMSGGLPGWTLNKTFQTNLKIVLLGGGKPWTMSNQLETDSKPRDITFLDSYALERWECVLHYMVGSQQQEGEIFISIVTINLHIYELKQNVFYQSLFFLWILNSHEKVIRLILNLVLKASKRSYYN